MKEIAHQQQFEDVLTLKHEQRAARQGLRFHSAEAASAAAFQVNCAKQQADGLGALAKETGKAAKHVLNLIGRLDNMRAKGPTPTPNSLVYLFKTYGDLIGGDPEQ